MEGYFFYRALITVFETDRLKTIHHYLIGYGCPVLVIIATVSVTLSGYEVYTSHADYRPRFTIDLLTNRMYV